MAKVAKTGWVNLHIHTDTKQVVASQHPYPTKEEANKGIYYGLGIQKLGCFFVEWEEDAEQ